MSAPQATLENAPMDEAVLDTGEREQILDQVTRDYLRGEVTIDELEAAESQLQPDLDLLLERMNLLQRRLEIERESLERERRHNRVWAVVISVLQQLKSDRDQAIHPSTSSTTKVNA